VLRKNIFIKKFLWHKKFLGNLQKKNHIGHLTWAKWRHTWALGRAKWALAHAKCPPSRVKRRHLRAKVAPSVDQWRNLAPLYYTSGAHAIHGFAMGPPRKKALRTRRGLSRNERFSWNASQLAEMGDSKDFHRFRDTLPFLKMFRETRVQLFFAKSC